MKIAIPMKMPMPKKMNFPKKVTFSKVNIVRKASLLFIAVFVIALGIVIGFYLAFLYGGGTVK